MEAEALVVTALIFVVAALYSSVGHAGASGYLAVMALFGLQQSIAKPTALTLNLLVATITVAQFARAGHFSWRTLAPFLIGSLPFAFFGGAITLPDAGYKLVVAFALLIAALRLMLRIPTTEHVAPPRWFVAIPTGSAVGLLAGLTGTGGGVFLTPLLLFFHWTNAKSAAGISAAFILGNSIAGLIGLLAKGGTIPTIATWWIVAAGVGGTLGSYFGAKKLGGSIFRKLLGAALLVAVVKLILESTR